MPLTLFSYKSPCKSSNIYSHEWLVNESDIQIQHLIITTVHIYKTV